METVFEILGHLGNALIGFGNLADEDSPHHWVAWLAMILMFLAVVGMTVLIFLEI